MKVELLKGKIAEVNDEYSVIINIGYNQGVRNGMKFVIYSIGNPIFDPDTKKEIGNYEVVKGDIEVVNASENCSEAKTYKSYTTGMFPLQTVFTTITKKDALVVDKNKIKEKEKKDLTIRIGDSVRQIIE